MASEKKSFKERWNEWWFANGDAVAAGAAVVIMGGVVLLYGVAVGYSEGRCDLLKEMAETDPTTFKEMVAKLTEKSADELIAKISEKVEEK